MEIPFGTSSWPQGAGRNKCAVVHPIHVSNSHTKFGWTSSNGLGGDSVTVGRTEAIAISLDFPKSVHFFSVFYPFFNINFSLL